MKKEIIRVVSVLMAIILLIGTAPVPAWAAEGEVPEVTVPEETIPEVTIPEQTAPDTTVPEETVPVVTEPEETEPVELPAVTTADGHYIARPSLLNRFRFPDNWSRSALEFCVGNEILSGRDDGLAPNAYTTRAETAAILVRLLGAKANHSALKGYRDVDRGAWYYDEISAAVSVGLMKGTSETTIEPNARITREDACVLLSRAFGVYSSSHDYYLKFKDADKVSDYARAAISGMAEQGYLTGYEDGSVNPKANITRAELAKLIYELVTRICRTPEELASPGRIVYSGSEPIPDGFGLVGNLILGCNYPTDSTLSHVWVSNRLVLRMKPGSVIHLNECSTSRVVVASDITLSGNKEIFELYAGGENANLDIPINAAYVYCGCTVEGRVKKLHCSEGGICVTMNGTTDSAQLHKSYITLQGSGYAQNVDIYGRECRVTLKNGNCTDHVYLLQYNTALDTVQTVSSWYNYQRQEPYSTATMEGFVNQKGYSSETEYLIWVSTTTTTVNVFKGSKGNWKLERSMACALGAPGSPTVRGTFSTYKRQSVWDFGAYKCRYVTLFYGGYAFHSRKWSPNYTYLVDPSINCLVSAGCVRMYDEDCYFIYSEVPIRTAVVVY